MFNKLKTLFSAAEKIHSQSQTSASKPDGSDATREVERLSRSAQQFEEEADWRSAADLYERIAKLEPENIRWIKDLAFVLSEDEAWDESIAVYEQVLALLPEDANAHCNIGRMRLQQDELEAAESHLQTALRIAPEHTHALFYQGMLCQRNKQFQESLVYFESSIRSEPSFHFALHNIAVSHIALGDTKAASEALCRCKDILHDGGLNLPLVMPPHKFAHDLEQLEYLAENGQEGLAGIADDWGTMADELDLAGLRSDDMWMNGQIVIDENSPMGVQHAAYQPLLRKEEGRLDRVLNPELDLESIQKQFLEGPLPAVAIDNVLTVEALGAMQRFCRNNTFWYNLKPGYLGAYLQDGFYCDLLFQLAEEMRAALPAILGQHHWRNMWGYSHDREHGGINIHADTAAVNVNYWLSPNDANLLPDAGGLIVWDKSPPAHWNFQKLNTDEEAIVGFLKESGAQPVHFPFRENRALIFRSDLFHRTDEVSFAPGYQNRRLNVTMLYGEREEIDIA
jgi:tetratricopeptide (TPR) repeat protein